MSVRTQRIFPSIWVSSMPSQSGISGRWLASSSAMYSAPSVRTVLSSHPTFSAMRVKVSRRLWALM